MGIAVGVLLLASCTDQGESLPPIERCGTPPADATAESSQYALVLEPNPIGAGAEADLVISGDGLPDDSVGAAGALWQCWTGTQWESTHQILRNFASQAGEARYIEPGTVVTIPAVGLPIPNSYQVRVPDAPPGTYRIVDEAQGESGESRTGIVVVVIE